MFRNYLKAALRGFLNRKLFTLINIIGLSIGISSALAVYSIAHFDLSFDRFYPDEERIFRVVSDLGSAKQRIYNGGVRGPLMEAARRTVTGLEEAAPCYAIDGFTLNHTGTIVPGSKAATLKFKYTPDVLLADARYFNIFSYRWIAGERSSLNKPFTVVLTAQRAKSYFPGLSYQQMLGRTLIYGDSIKTSVTGIVEEHMENSDFHFTDFISYGTGDHIAALKNNLQLTEWGGITPSNQFFVKLSDQSTPIDIEKQLNDLLKRNASKEILGQEDFPELRLQKLSDIHFDERYATFSSRTASRTTLNGLLLVGLILLLLGCINFINLTTAQATQRAKEIGVRKTLGGNRIQLIAQFLQETFFLTLFAVLLACLMVPLILKIFGDFIPPGVSFDFLRQPDLIVFLVLLTFTVSFCAGFYPAWILSSFKPVDIMKTRPVNRPGTSRIPWLRRSLTVTQFTIAQFLIMVTMLVGKQIYYVLHKDLGFKKEAILNISTPWNSKDARLKQVYLEKIRSLPSVQAISLGGAPPASDNTHSTGLTYFNGKKEINFDVQERYGDENYIKVYGIPLLAGRDIAPNDFSKAMLINVTCAKRLGFKNPGEAVGHVVNYAGKKMQVAGVMGDFYYRSLHSAIEPMVIVTRSDNNYFSSTLHIALKPQMGGKDWQSAIASMKAFWKSFYPTDDFEYHFFDQEVAGFYETEQRTSTLLTWATGLSILISCLGLLGLAIYTANRRTKEIGIRKVLGASVMQIATLLTSEMFLLVGMALVIATPIGWIVMNSWIESYADRTPISWWIFAMSGAGMLATALCTIGLLTINRAKANPVNSLRVE